MHQSKQYAEAHHRGGKGKGEEERGKNKEDSRGEGGKGETNLPWDWDSLEGNLRAIAPVARCTRYQISLPFPAKRGVYARVYGSCAVRAS